MSTGQRETLDAILRQSAFPIGSDVNEQRRLLRELISAQPLPPDVTVTAAAALDRAGQLLSAHLASAERVTA